MNKKLISAIAAISLAVSSAVSLTSSASGTPRDPNGDGAVNMADAVFINQHLIGREHPSNLTPLDFDKNGIISQMDSYKLQLWCLNYNLHIPDMNPNDPVVPATVGSKGYRRHNYRNGPLTTYDSYTLTTSFTTNNAVDMATIYYPNDMVRDYNTAIVKLDNNTTGFIIGDHIIATAAENVYDRDTFKFKNFTINIIGSSGNVLESVSPHYAHIPTSYAYGSHSMENNYALIYVDTDLSQYGKLKMGEMLDVYADDNNPVIVSGFPSIYPPGYSGSNSNLRFSASGTVSLDDDNNNLLRYTADCTNSESGAPVYVEEGVTVSGNFEEYKTVIAIHNKENYGIRINDNMLKFFYTNDNLTS